MDNMSGPVGGRVHRGGHVGCVMYHSDTNPVTMQAVHHKRAVVLTTSVDKGGCFPHRHNCCHNCCHQLSTVARSHLALEHGNRLMIRQRGLQPGGLKPQSQLKLPGLQAGEGMSKTGGDRRLEEAPNLVCGSLHKRWLRRSHSLHGALLPVPVSALRKPHAAAGHIPSHLGGRWCSCLAIP